MNVLVAGAGVALFFLVNFVRSFFVQESDLETEQDIDQLHRRFNSKMEELKREKRYKEIGPQTDDFNEQIFKIVNKGKGLDEIDLHGLFKKYAVQYCEARIKKITEMIRNSQPNAPRQLIVITGIGNGSGEGGPKIKPAIKDYLTDNNINHTEISNRGAFLVLFSS
ncbi:hypothetical protein CYY_007504 [Polysphondylium violaceum]|uniref:Smr domain-containing protein n=1 Tax=Polysphondylium violaceum TaxID=133409 RepID=A0A8J4PPJ9_9MYCE|nr:hypothetical protein CYY_007504 [Polysphondylium violaceum]